MLTSGILLLLMGRLRGSVTATRGDWKAIESQSVEYGTPGGVLQLTSCCEPRRCNPAKENRALDIHGYTLSNPSLLC